MRTYNRNNCDSKVRAIIKDSLGNTITLLGKHAFEWSIAKEVDGRIVITSFSNRKQANKEFKKYK